MSTITVAKKDGRVAIAADSMSCRGSDKDLAEYVTNHQKIVSVGKSYLAVSGPTSAKLALRDFFGAHQEHSFDDVQAIYRAWLRLHRALKETYYLNGGEDKDSFESSRMDVLIANPNGIFGVPSHRSVQEFSQFYAYGSGAPQALGAMYVAYSRPELTAEDVARIGIEAGAQFDLYSSLPVTSYSLPLTY